MCFWATSNAYLSRPQTIAGMSGIEVWMCQGAVVEHEGPCAWFVKQHNAIDSKPPTTAFKIDIPSLCRQASVSNDRCVAMNGLCMPSYACGLM